MSGQDRVHEASPIRLLQARQEGRVARSAELTRSLVLCAMIGFLFLFAGVLQSVFEQQLVELISKVRISWSDDLLTEHSVGKLAFPILIFLVGVAVFALSIWHLQSPLNPNLSRALPDLSRLSPNQAWTRLLSGDHWIRVGLLTLGFCLAVYWLIAGTWSQSTTIASFAARDLNTGIALSIKFLRTSLIATGVLVLLLGLADYIRERIHLAGKLRMTDQERREEARNSEMNPEIRRRLYG